MEELLQAPTDDVGDAIVVPPILANQFELKIGFLNLVTAILFHGFANDDPHSHIRRFTKITQTIKLNQVPHDIIKLILFVFSLEGAARTWLEKEPPNSITTWNDLVSKFVNQFFPPSRTTNLRNEITIFQQKFNETFSEVCDRFEDLLNKCPHHGFSPLHQIYTFYNGLNQSDQDSLNSAAGGNLLTRNTHEALTIIKNKSKVQTSRNKHQVSSGSGSSSQNDASIALTKQVESLVSSMNKSIHSIQEGCETCGGPHSYFECQAVGGYTQDVYATAGNYNAGGQLAKALQERPQGVLPSNTILNPQEDIKVITTQSGTIVAGPSVPPPTSSSCSKEVERNPKPTMDQMFKKLHINISLAEALAFMPKYAKMLKDLISNKEKLLELANTPLTENCSAVHLKQLPKKLGDPRKFLIPCDFFELEKCMALADLGASINLMPLSVWKKLMLPKLVPTHITLELANRSVAYPAGIAEDVFVQVDKFTFPADFIVVDYDVDPRFPLILGIPFLRTAHALVDVYGEELILRDGDEELIFHTDRTSKYPHKYGNESINMINFIDITCEDHFHEVLKIQKSIHPFSDSTTPPSDSFPSLTPFKTSDSLLEEFADELALIESFLPEMMTFTLMSNLI
ncbi:reverse transcriptase domain-containing protein [Tanacetum coccineum]